MKILLKANKTISFITLTLALIACERDQLFVERTGDEPLLTKVLLEGESFQEYTYTNASLISEEKSRFFYTRHTYNPAGQLASSEFYMDPGIVSSSSYVLEETMKRKEWVNADNTARNLTKTYIYDDKGNVVRINFYRPSNNIPQYLEYTWEDDRISRQQSYWENKLSGYTEYEYDIRGNLIKQSKYSVLEGGIASLMTTTEYEHDNMKNPYLSFRALTTPGKYTNPNNITKETYTIHFEVDAFIEKVQISTETYKYNKEGYPVEVNGEAVYVYN